MIEKPLVTISGNKTLLGSELHQRISQDLPQAGVDWCRRSDGIIKSVYVDVKFVEFDDELVKKGKNISNKPGVKDEPEEQTIDQAKVSQQAQDQPQTSGHRESDDTPKINRKLLGEPILHTYWADKTDFEVENKKSQFEEWIANVQASDCTEWAIIIIDDGDFKAQIGTVLFKSKLQSSTSQANISSSSSSSSIAGTTQTPSAASLLDRMKKGLSTIFQTDSNSDRWLTLVNQSKPNDTKAQESYLQFIKKFRNVIATSFSKAIELFEEQLKTKREMRNEKSWDFLEYFSMQEELAFSFELLTLFDEALLQYDLLDALFTEYIATSGFNRRDDPLFQQLTSFDHWHGLCLDLNCNHSIQLRQRIVERRASLLDLRNYLFAKQSDLMLLQNQPWRVAAAATSFLQNCVKEHEQKGIKTLPGALSCWVFTSALEVLQKCECYSCTSTMGNYSLHTVDIWNCARRKILELGNLVHLMPGSSVEARDADLIKKLLDGSGDDPHEGSAYAHNEITPQARLREALSDQDKFAKHLIHISELTLGTYKHIGRKRHALLIGKELAEFYMSRDEPDKALPFLLDMEKVVKAEKWDVLVEDVGKIISKCKEMSRRKGNDDTKS